MKKLITLCWIGISCSFLATPLFSQNEIEGKYVYVDEARSPLEGVEVFLKDMNGNTIATTFTDEKGKYLFKDVKRGNYVIGGNSNYDLDLGHTGMDDLFAIKQHLTGEKRLEGIFLLAADIDGNGIVDWDDYNFFLKDWFLEKRHITEENWALKDGVEGSGTPDPIPPPPTPPPVPKSEPINRFSIALKSDGIIKYNSENKYKIPLYYKGRSSIEGFGLILKYPIDLIVIEKISDIEDNINYTIEDDIIRISYLNSNNKINITNTTPPLVNVHVRLKTKKFPELQDFIFGKKSHLIDTNGQIIEDAILTMPIIVNNEQETKLKAIFPNPVHSQAKIEYILSTTSDVKLSIYSLNGQQIAELINTVQNPGNYQFEFDAENYNLANGTYIYRLDCIGEQIYSKSKLFIINK